MERAIAERLPSGAMTASSTPGRLPAPGRSAWQPVGLDAVVVGEQDAHGHAGYCPARPRRATLSAAALRVDARGQMGSRQRRGAMSCSIAGGPQEPGA
jgi:hypothetical protein